ncbi:MAG: hypothetical protein WKF56_09385 [Candidatus Limnocylindrales bacterium]
MSDDLREREPARDQGDQPSEDGVRSDQAGTGGSTVGPAPAAGGRNLQVPSVEEPSGGQGSSSGGGYGVGSDRASSGGSGEGQDPIGSDPQTEWLRRED